MNNKIVETKEATYQVVKSLSGGKSHDKLFIVQDHTKKTKVLKMSQNKEKLSGEIKFTKYARELFAGRKYNPIIRIYHNGLAEYENDIYHYYLMENLGDEQYIELHKVIEWICTHPFSKKFDIKKILLNIYNILTVFKLNKFSHCDLHTKNIFVHKKTQAIKIIDFGIATNKLCRKRREVSESIIQSFKNCNLNLNIKDKLGLYYKLIRGEYQKSRHEDSDLSMFATIVFIFYKDQEGIKKLYELSSRIFDASSSNRIQLLNEYGEILARIINYGESIRISKSPKNAH